MILPGRLGATTLGDLLGALHRAETTGALELVEIGVAGRGVPGRVHRVHFALGRVVAVESELAPADALEARVDALFALADARIRFHVARDRRSPFDPSLEPRAFLHGRPRARDGSRGRRSASDEVARSPLRAARAKAFALLGLPEGADVAEIRRAFRKLASAHHPDAAGGASSDDLRTRGARLAELTAAYHVLVA